MSSADRADDPEDPIAYFLEDITFQGKSDRTREAYGRALRRFERFLADPDRNPRGEPLAPGEASHRDCMAFVHSLRGGLAESTVASYGAYLHRFYAYMTQVGAFDANPMALVIEEMDESIDKDPTRREITLEDMRAFVVGISHPLDRAVVVALLKTGLRAGELCNLDLRDLALEDPELVETYDLGSRSALDNRPRSLYVSSEPAVGVVVNGAERTATNKRKRDTIIPVDDELAAVLKRWLAVRPDALCDSEPLFLSTRDSWGQRLDPAEVLNLVRSHARERGWYRIGGGASENVTPHYFRHFFTTHLRDRTGDRGVVKYLRGDVADDIIDTYTHNWGDQVRETYEANIYTLLE